MADGQTVVHGRVSCAETRSAECCFDNGACRHEVCHAALSHKVHEDRLGGRIHIQRELAETAALSAQHIGRLDDVRVVAARAARDDALLHLQLSVHDLIEEREFSPAVRYAFRLYFDSAEDIREVRVQFIDLERVAGMERKRDHGLYGAQVDIDAAVVIGHISGIQFPVILRSAVSGQIFLRVLVRSPYGGQTGGLRRHDVDAVPVIRRHG